MTEENSPTQPVPRKEGQNMTEGQLEWKDSGARWHRIQKDALRIFISISC